MYLREKMFMVSQFVLFWENELHKNTGKYKRKLKKKKERKK